MFEAQNPGQEQVTGAQQYSLLDLMQDAELRQKVVVLSNSLNLAVLAPQNDTVHSVLSEAGLNESEGSEQACMGFSVKVCPVVYQARECQMLTLTPLCRRRKRDSAL